MVSGDRGHYLHIQCILRIRRRQPFWANAAPRELILVSGIQAGFLLLTFPSVKTLTERTTCPTVHGELVMVHLGKVPGILASANIS